MMSVSAETLPVRNLKLGQRVQWHKALTLEERLARVRSRPGVTLEPDPRQGADRLSRWMSQQALNGEPLDFPSLHHCSDSELLLVLGDSSARDRDEPPPAWLSRLERVYVEATRHVASTVSLSAEPSILSVIELPARDARERLAAFADRVLARYPQAPFDAETLSDTLFAPLALRLEFLVTQCVVLEMHAARIERRLRGKTPQERYMTFLLRLTEPESSARLLATYPVLARLIVTALDDWIEASSEFVERLARDWPVISKTLGSGQEDDRLISFEARGDPHCGGRRVGVCVFRSGLRVVYKPRPVANELHFQDLLRWVNERSALPTLRTLTVIPRNGYGWVEFVQAAYCDSVEELRAFYRRQGAYIAILHVLAAQDFHHENVVASGDQPVMVDLESILQPTALAGDAQVTPAERVAGDLTSESVLRIGLLPVRTLARGDRDGLDLSGLGATSGQTTPMRLPQWAEEGTDSMHQILSEASLGAVQSRPIPPTMNLSVSDFTDEVVTGFRDAYDLVLLHRRELLAKNGPLAAFATDETRCIVRPTVAYAMLLRSSFHPQFLTDGLSRELQFDRLLGARPRLHGSSLDEVRAAEREDLWRLDIPRFTSRPDSSNLWSSSNRRIRGFLPEAGMETVRRRVERLSDDERDLQSWMIRTSIATASLATANGHAKPTPMPNAPLPLAAGRDPLESAVSVADRVTQLAITDGGTATWIGLASERGERWWISPVGPELYEGLAGIALFLAHVGSITGEPRYRELARAAVRTLRAQVARGALGESIGGFVGYGGHAYALAHLAAPLEDASLLDEAAGTIPVISDLVDSCSGVDIVAGSAGCIAALLALHGARPTDQALDIAIRCGDKLLETAVVTTDGLGWLVEEISSRPLGGFAHGTAGISWALLELFGATREARFRDAAIEAIRYDRSLFSQTAGNWLDVRENLPPRRLGVISDEGICLAHWCHGAGGIGLARLRCRRHWDDGIIEHEIETAIKATLAHGFGSSHSLCHGDLGNLELLTEAHRQSPNTRLEREIARISGHVLASIERQGCTSGHVMGIESPGLMMGIAGIGYGLLRLAAPDRVPCVLLLDQPIT